MPSRFVARSRCIVFLISQALVHGLLLSGPPISNEPSLTGGLASRQAAIGVNHCQWCQWPNPRKFICIYSPFVSWCWLPDLKTRLECNEFDNFSSLKSPPGCRATELGTVGMIPDSFGGWGWRPTISCKDTSNSLMHNGISSIDIHSNLCLDC